MINRILFTNTWGKQHILGIIILLIPIFIGCDGVYGVHPNMRNIYSEKDANIVFYFIYQPVFSQESKSQFFKNTKIVYLKISSDDFYIDNIRVRGPDDVCILRFRTDSSHLDITVSDRKKQILGITNIDLMEVNEGTYYLHVLCSDKTDDHAFPEETVTFEVEMNQEGFVFL